MPLVLVVDTNFNQRKKARNHPIEATTFSPFPVRLDQHEIQVGHPLGRALGCDRAGDWQKLAGDLT